MNDAEARQKAREDVRKMLKLPLIDVAFKDRLENRLAESQLTTRFFECISVCGVCGGPKTLDLEKNTIACECNLVESKSLYKAEELKTIRAFLTLWRLKK